MPDQRTFAYIYALSTHRNVIYTVREGNVYKMTFSLEQFWGKLTENIKSKILKYHTEALPNKKTYCVTLCARRLRSASLLTIARSPPRSEHCFRASVQLISPGTIWKQHEDSASYRPSFGQWGEAGRGKKEPHRFPRWVWVSLATSRSTQSSTYNQFFTTTLCLCGLIFSIFTINYNH